MRRNRFDIALRAGVAGTAVLIGTNLRAQISSESSPSRPAAVHSSADPALVKQAGVGDIVVTARKRSESINNVGMSITAASAAKLNARGVFNTADLAQIVPGLSFTQGSGGQPIYTIRGVGLFDSGLASAPAVAVYVDQVPLATNNMTSLPPFDLERVEVLKGPQGTLFGASSTGGAINYVEAKPTTRFAAGVNARYERYNLLAVDGYVSGPITGNLTGRIAAQGETGGAWQYSISRPGDHLGARRYAQVRSILDWTPASNLKFELSAQYGRDQSDSQARRLYKKLFFRPDLLAPSFLAVQPPPKDPRAAEWNPGLRLRLNDKSLITYLRGEYAVTSDITITTLTAYQHFRQDLPSDQSGFVGPSLIGATGPAFYVRALGKVDDFYQEVRANGSLGKAKWTVGANYDRKHVDENDLIDTSLTTSKPLPFLPPFRYVAGSIDQKIRDYAVFGTVDYSFTRALTAHAGLRYTRSDRHSLNCTYDWAGDGALDNVITGLQQVFSAVGVKTTPVVSPTGQQCVTLTNPPDLSPQVGGTPLKLNEDNVSWRFGLDYKTRGGTLLYASANRGYKAGIISVFTASSVDEYKPAKQERLDAFEVGFKAPLGGTRYHLNGAAFYYIYKDKQLRTLFLSPIFGPQNQLSNIPRSRIFGLEADLVARPIDGLTLTLAGTYLDTDVDKTYVAYNFEQVAGDFKGSQLPYTSRWQVTSDVQYERPVSDTLLAFVGANFSYRTKQNATFNSKSAPAPNYEFGGYGLLDLRAGIGAQDGRWRATAFGKNVTNKLYTTSTYTYSDYITRTVGEGSVWGLQLGLRF